MPKFYNVWTIIEEVDEETDSYEDITDHPVKLGNFNTLDEAINACESMGFCMGLNATEKPE